MVGLHACMCQGWEGGKFFFKKKVGHVASWQESERKLVGWVGCMAGARLAGRDFQ
jgi:hypothetical protein